MLIVRNEANAATVSETMSDTSESSVEIEDTKSGEMTEVRQYEVSQGSGRLGFPRDRRAGGRTWGFPKQRCLKGIEEARRDGPRWGSTAERRRDSR